MIQKIERKEDIVDLTIFFQFLFRNCLSSFRYKFLYENSIPNHYQLDQSSH